MTFANHKIATNFVFDKISEAIFSHIFYLIPTESTNPIFGMNLLRLHRAKLNVDKNTFSICPSLKPKIQTSKMW